MSRRELALLHARLPEHYRRVERAAAVVSRALEAAPSWYIALSGGKDSTCVLNLVRALAPSIRANFSQRQWDLPETLEYLAGVPSLDRVSYNAHAGREWLPNWESRDEAQAAGVRWLSGEEIKTRGSSEAVVFLGLRADENRYRREHLRKFGSLYYCEATNQWHCNPIAEWSALDVWAYICAGDIPYSAAYDVMERIGVPLEQQRVGPFGFALNAGSLAIIKRGWPEFYNQLAAQHPEARSYA